MEISIKNLKKTNLEILKPFSRVKIELTEKKLEEKENKPKKESNQEKVENGTKN